MKSELIARYPIIERISREEELFWANPQKTSFSLAQTELGYADIIDASERLKRFEPLIRYFYPEVKNGVIESELTLINGMRDRFFPQIKGNLYLKRDDSLPVAGSVKARGGIYEVLKHTEELALEHGILKGTDDDYLKLKDHRDFFSEYKVQVGSTGNLGMSIGLISAKIGYCAIVHMSSDAKKWKKDYLRQHGVTVKEYDSDYTEAVGNGREESSRDPRSYFVDDENSRNLFLGYAVSALRLKNQLRIDANNKTSFYLPCGVGGAPGGICFGLKQIFKDDVNVYFAEPTKCCSMLLGQITGLHHDISVKDIGLSGITEADGLACPSPSGFVGREIENLLDGIYTCSDNELYRYEKELFDAEGIFIEPSSCAAFKGLELVRDDGNSHVIWATGGILVPENERERFLRKYIND